MLKVNPYTCLIQSRLFAPNHSFDGRWTAFDASSRRSFALVGNKDGIPEGVKLLTRLSDQSESVETEQQAGRLADAGLVIKGDIEDSVDIDPSFLDFYDRANWNYDYQDYSDIDGFLADRELMLSYRELGDPPDNFTIREGEEFRLPPCMFEMPSTRTQCIDLLSLAKVLKMAFGATGLLEGGALGPWLRKTSPSGGARHPTECVVLIPGEFHGVPVGAWVYDAANHRLVRDVRTYRPLLREIALRDDELALMLRLRVERPMWRYREMRSLRPATIDVGHVCETLELLLGVIGYDTVTEPPGNVDDERPDAWLQEPDMALIRVIKRERETGVTAVRPGMAKSSVTALGYAERSTRYLTNPFMFFHFRGGFRMRIIWPKSSAAAISLSAFQALSHCLPSQRGDRETTIEAIERAVPALRRIEIDKLIATGALVERQRAIEWYRGVGLWSRYDWYLSLLAILEFRSDFTEPERTALGNEIPQCLHRLGTGSDANTLGEALLSRRTTRRFSSAEVPLPSMQTVLDEGALSASELKCKSSLYVSANAITGLQRGLYAMGTSHELTEVRSGEEYSASDLARICAHQSGASTSAWTTWIVVDLSTMRNTERQLALVHLGQIAQRMVLAAVCLGLGAFQSPAVRDVETVDFLRLKGVYSLVFYVLGFGLSEGAELSRPIPES